MDSVYLLTILFLNLCAVPLTEAKRQRITMENDPDCRRASSRGLIPKAKVKTIKMTFVIVFGEHLKGPDHGPNIQEDTKP
jgi:hypothetical protein